MDKTGRADAHGKAEAKQGLRALSGRRVLGDGQAIFVAAGAAAGGALAAGVAWLFYDSPAGLLWGCILIPAGGVLFNNRLCENRRRQIQNDLREFLVLLSSFLTAGYALENAVFQAQKELVSIGGRKGIFVRHLERTVRRMQMHVPVEESFGEMSRELSCPELTSFSQILSYSKRMGGNYAASIRRVSEKLGARIDTEQEIRTTLSEKRLELRLMCAMPAAVMVYVRLTSPEYLESVYGTAGGALFMTVCVAVYLGAAWLGQAMVQKSTEVAG